MVYVNHTCINVSNLERSLHFYKDILGLKEKRRFKGASIIPGSGEITLVFLGDEIGGEIELRYESDHSYQVGDKIAHLCIYTNDFDGMIKKLKKSDVTFLVEPTQPKYRKDIGQVTFIEDHEGVKIEIIESI